MSNFKAKEGLMEFVKMTTLVLLFFYKYWLVILFGFLKFNKCTLWEKNKIDREPNVSCPFLGRMF